MSNNKIPYEAWQKNVMWSHMLRDVVYSLCFFALLFQFFAVLFLVFFLFFFSTNGRYWLVVVDDFSRKATIILAYNMSAEQDNSSVKQGLVLRCLFYYRYYMEKSKQYKLNNEFNDQNKTSFQLSNSLFQRIETKFADVLNCCLRWVKSGEKNQQKNCEECKKQQM